MFMVIDIATSETIGMSKFAEVAERIAIDFGKEFCLIEYSTWGYGAKPETRTLSEALRREV